MTKTALVLFAGFGGVEIALKQAGYQTTGIEIDADIAAVNNANLGGGCIVADILMTNPADCERPNWLHASPPCPNFSNAKAGGEETETDRALAAKVAEYITVLRPDTFSLENVYQYRNSNSFTTILEALHAAGYQFDYWHLNAADYGVPQTRQRLILLASMHRKPQKPAATHQQAGANEPGQLGLFGALPPWVGWYESIEDLIPTLPESKFAPWQLERLPDEITSGMVMSGNNNFQDAKPGKGFLNLCEPANTVTAQLTGGYPRAFIVDGKLSTSGNEKMLQINADTVPSGTVVASHSAFRDTRAAIGGKVVKMTSSALARFQSFPDWYELPDSNTLACKGIGNAVPPKLMSAIIREMEG